MTEEVPMNIIIIMMLVIAIFLSTIMLVESILRGDVLLSIGMAIALASVIYGFIVYISM